MVGGMRHHEGLLIGLDQIDDEAGGLAVLRLHQERLGDEHRPSGIDHDARAAIAQRAEAVGAHQPPGFAGRICRKLENHVGQIDHDPIGIGQNIDAVAHRTGQVGDETGLAVIARHSCGERRYWCRACAHRRRHQRRQCQHYSK